LTLLLVDAIMFNSICAADQLRALFKFRKVTIHAVQNAIEDQTSDRQMLRKELSQRFGFSPNNLWIGSLGRLDPKKRFDLLFRVIALLQEDFKDFHFLLIGDGPERMHLEEMADTLGIAGRITFAGEVPGASAWLGALDIFCFTSLDEGIPNAVMEAAVAGVPIVTWGVPFIEEFLEDGKTARLVDPEDLPGFRDVLLELIPSPELRLMLGTNARDHVIKDFSLDRFIQQMTNLYDDLLGFSQAPDCVDA
jgi:glycosyltransferase involved in cell wall biosynthesis